MATAALVPLDEYLRTSYRPDRDYVEGEVLERAMGEQQHANVQGLFYFIFQQNRKQWRVRPLPEQRVQVTSTRFRVPDVSVLNADDPWDPIITFAPLICIEVLSKTDTMSDLQERVNDYASMGVRNIWAVDPLSRAGYYCSSRGFQQPEDGFLRVEGTDIAVALADVFAELDQAD